MLNTGLVEEGCFRSGAADAGAVQEGGIEGRREFEPRIETIRGLVQLVQSRTVLPRDVVGGGHVEVERSGAGRPGGDQVLEFGQPPVSGSPSLIEDRPSPAVGTCVTQCSGEGEPVAGRNRPRAQRQFGGVKADRVGARAVGGRVDEEEAASTLLERTPATTGSSSPGSQVQT